MEELLKDRKKPKWISGGDTVVAEGEVTHMAAAGSEVQSHLFVSEVRVHQQDTEEGQEACDQVKAPPQKRRTVNTCRVCGDTRLCVSPPKSRLDQKRVPDDQKNMEELSLVPSAVSGPRWALPVCDNRCGAKGFKFFEIAAIVSQRGGATRMINLCKNCYNETRLMRGEEEVHRVNKTVMIEQNNSRGKLWAAFGVDQRMWYRFAINEAWARSVVSDAQSVKQLGTDGRWQYEAP